LHNRFDNPQESWTVWDHVLYDFVVRESNLELLLNTQTIDSEMDGATIVSARCWQATTEVEYTIRARQFIDCSGDGLLAATTGALYRTGREAASEFGESYAPEKADGWHQGASLVMTSKDMGRPMRYQPPSFALEYEAEKSHPMRKIGAYVDGIWWIELGSDHDIIADQEVNRHKLMGYMHGVWDYIKN
ncbi:MAG: FAD-dependent oxidoreductase, partial [Victivallales bacterium]|nr:FAD-dependent oxidoreductase [Victivallales bacterium]